MLAMSPDKDREESELSGVLGGAGVCYTDEIVLSAT